MRALHYAALGASVMVLMDHVIDIQNLTWTALIVAILCIIIESGKYGRRLYS